jgi:hypothetical protein
MSNEDVLPPWLELQEALSWVLYRDPALPKVRGFYGPEYGPRGPDGEIIPEPPRIGEMAELRNALLSAEITAHGQDSMGRDYRIAPLDWMRRSLSSTRFGAAAWLPSAELLSKFPPLTEVDSYSNIDEQRRSIAAETQCKNWLADRLSKDPYLRCTKAQFKKDALKFFDGRLSERGFGRVWDAMAGEDRKRPGRKRKS